jgi:hypothetical protein
MNINTTPVPNMVFDVYLKNLKLAELKVLLIIIRQTLGWEDKKNKYGRKSIDWISNNQLVQKSGSSARSINDAIRVLSDNKLIEIISQKGEILDTADKRKGQQRLYYRYTNANFATVYNKGITVDMECKSPFSNADFAGNLRKNITELSQKMRITKETIQN